METQTIPGGTVLRKIGSIVAVSIFASLVVGCGGEDEDATLTCAWLKSEDNCWARALAEAETCLPPSSDVGVFDDSLQVCTYESGHVVSLAEPVVFPLDASTAVDEPWAFSIEKGGQSCLSWDQTNMGDLTLTTASGTVRMQGSKGHARVTCQDGKTYKTDRAVELIFTCDQGSPGMSVMGHDQIHFMATGAFGESSFLSAVNLFSCEPEEAI